jgi:hypothetical protein
MADIIVEKTGYNKNEIKKFIRRMSREMRRYIVENRGLNESYFGFVYESHENLRSFYMAKWYPLGRKSKAKYREPTKWAEKKRKEALLNQKQRLVPNS